VVKEHKMSKNRIDLAVAAIKAHAMAVKPAPAPPQTLVFDDEAGQGHSTEVTHAQDRCIPESRKGLRHLRIRPLGEDDHLTAGDGGQLQMAVFVPFKGELVPSAGYM
jgi:hypothetical protein